MFGFPIVRFILIWQNSVPTLQTLALKACGVSEQLYTVAALSHSGMNNPMREFLLIIRGDAMEHMSPDEVQQLLGSFRDWIAEVGDKFVMAQKLEGHGAMLLDSDTVVTDGPFLEPKEMVAGFILVRAADMESAISMANATPFVPHYRMEVRQLCNI